ncbi:hypothetical protein D3C84_944380 [compost metagenome]
MSGNLNVWAIKIAAVHKTGLDLVIDPGIAELRIAPDFLLLLAQLGHVGGIQADQVVNQEHALGGGGKHTRQLLGLGTADLATQSDHPFAAFDFYRGGLGMSTPE